MIEKGEMWLRGAHIPPYLPASSENHDPERPRKLLLHRREIERLIGKTAEKGLTLVPTRIYFKGPAPRSRSPRQGQGGGTAAARSRTATSGARSSGTTSSASHSRHLDGLRQESAQIRLRRRETERARRTS